MKQLSARRFRLTFPDITEPVEVITRDGSGTYRLLGRWIPWDAALGTASPTSPMGPPQTLSDLTGSLSRFGTSKPAPKPGAKR